MIKGINRHDYFRRELIRTQYEIFRELGIPVDFNKSYRNPLRKDKSPGCRFWMAPDGIIYFMDYAQPNYGGNAFKMHRIKYSKNPNTLLYGDTINKPMPSKKPKNKYTYLKNMTRDMKEYFARAGVNVESIKGRYTIKQVSRIFLGKNNTVIMPEDLTISYLYPSGREKVYRPYCENPKYKWWSSTTSEDIWGFTPLCNKIGITSSMKDACVLQAEDKDRTWIAPQSETYKFPYELLDMFRQRDAIVLYDNDEVGIASTKQFQNLSIPCYVVPIEKDPYDFKVLTQSTVLNHLKKIS